MFNDELKKKIKVPTQKGIHIGLRSARSEYRDKENIYYTIIYNKPAQEWLVRNMEKFINGEVVD